MSKLSEERCEACRPDSAPATDAEVQQWLEQLTHWRVVDVEGMPHLIAHYSFKNFADALVFTNRIGELAESENHHPKITTEWGSVTVEWWTHAIGGLHKNDFVMAARIDSLGG